MRQFYSVNAGFFLLVIVLCFGFMSGAEHMALATSFVSSTTTILIPFAIWFIYLFKVVRFNYQVIGRKENEFIIAFRLLPLQDRITTLISIALSQLFPALLYGTFICLIAVRLEMYAISALTLAVLITMVIVACFTTYGFIGWNRSEIKTGFLGRSVNLNLTRGFVFISAEWILRREPFVVLSTKIFSCTLISVVALLYNREAFDWRLLAMGLTFAFAGNLVLITELHRFWNYNFTILRNLPIRLAQRLVFSLVVIVIVCVPEFVFVFRYSPSYFTETTVIALALYGLSITLLFYCLQYVVTQKNTVRVFFAITTLWIFLILFSVHPFLITAINSVTGAAIYFNRFYRYQFIQ